MNINQYNLLANLANLSGYEFYVALGKTIYYVIFFLAVAFGFFKVMEAGYQIIKKSNGGSPAWALVEHKQEIWDCVRGLALLTVGLVVIKILIVNSGLFPEISKYWH